MLLSEINDSSFDAMIWCNIIDLRFYLTRTKNIKTTKNDVWFVKQINTISNCSRVK